MTDTLPDAIRAGARLGGRYRLEAVVGTGGMAVVWRAEDESLGRPVAVKVMSDALAQNMSYVSRFAREARIAARISHPNLVEVYDYSATAERPYLVMQYLDGGTLESRLARGPLDPEGLYRLAADLLSALEAVHRADVLHRDVKPANVLLDRDGHARLTDFGIARLQDGTSLTQPGHLVGTLRFLAPELTRGAAPTPQSDLYSLGVLLAEAGGARPPAGIGALTDWLRRDDPGERPPSAEVALHALREDTLSRIPVPRDTQGESQEPTAATPEAAATRVSPRRPARTASAARVSSPQPPARRASAGIRGTGAARRTPAAVALVLLAAVLAIAIIAGSGGSASSGTSSHSAPARVPAGLTLAQRLARLDAAVRSAPGR
ncbi:MAG TPA: serine/threonine-protein kinase [Solirubrobacteraceae bacterium]|nr:serine/threonine-protein kinase [Solirubrobacteraceae bacterium]